MRGIGKGVGEMALFIFPLFVMCAIYRPAGTCFFYAKIIYLLCFIYGKFYHFLIRGKFIGIPGGYTIGVQMGALGYYLYKRIVNIMTHFA
jgi:hypothetical protein